MLELILIIILIQRIRAVADRKGESKGRWTMITVGTWVACEFLGILLFVSLFTDGNVENLDPAMNILMFLFGPVCGFGGYLIVRRQLDQLPDKDRLEDKIDEIGNEDRK